MSRRTDLLDQMEELVEEAEAASGSGWTQARNRKWAELSRELTALDRRAASGGSDVPEPASGRPDPEGFNSRGTAREPEARALRPDESAVEYLEARGQLDTPEEYRDLSLGSYLRAVLLGPDTDAERRALEEGTDASGGFTVPDILSAELIDRLRPRSHVLGAGARMVPIESDSHSFARVATDPTPSWQASEGDAVSEQDPTFENIEFQPKTVAFIVKASRELLQDSVNLETALPGVFSQVMANELDRVALLGDSASDEPVGVRNASNISEEDMGTDGAAISDYTPFTAIRRTILDANGPEPQDVIMAPREGQTINDLTDANNNPLRRPPALEDWQFRESSKIPTDESHGTATDASTAFVGGFERLWIGQRLGVEVQQLSERYADNLQVGFLVWARWDVQFEHPEALGRIVGITP